MAQEEGFEPPCLLGKRFSRPPRCDRFDIPAYFLKFVFRILARGGYLRQSRNILITMQNCAVIQVLSFLLDIALDVGRVVRGLHIHALI